jgi:DNA-binding NarL/FixJ family response regulator
VRAMGELNILVADDHEIVRQGIRNILQPQSQWTVVAEASNGNEAVEKSAELKPQVALIDVGMPEMNGLEATRRIREALPQTEVVILSVHESEQTVREAVSCGARGYVVKSDAGRDLIAAVESASRHQFFLSPKLAPAGDGYETRGREGPLAQLTRRECEILQLLAEGHGNKEIATRLDISVKTAETHRTNMMRKIDAHSLADLVRYAIRNGLVQP